MILISQKCEVQDFNYTKYSSGNQVGGLPGALHSPTTTDAKGREPKKIKEIRLLLKASAG